ncbi:hypothetical protein MANES_10G112780v8 [Manihot esculenta]|uniref:Uncharacterized protein n=1 Tax=Manihot esculenta TaxID=3983 RepID=A0ACB7H0N2_MANES|nr:hypothetical protein MANES_10G112780v8 [Manihot esculenta]
MVRWDDMDGTSALLQMVHQMSSSICRMCQGESDSKNEDCRNIITAALERLREEKLDSLSLYSVPATLVMLYSSPIEGNKFYGHNLIMLYMELILMNDDEDFPDEKASLGLEFCNLLRELSAEDPLYKSCRTILAELLGDYEIHSDYDECMITEILLFAFKLSQDLSNGLAKSFYRWEHIELLRIQFGEFGKFLCVLRKAIDVQIKVDENDDQNSMVELIVAGIGIIFQVHLKDMEQNLACFANMIQVFEKIDTLRSVSLLYLAILNELNSMSQLLEGAPDEFQRLLECQKNSLQIMIKNIMRGDDYDWLLEYIAMLDSESRMHLVMMKMIPEKRLRDAELYKPLIWWSENLDKKLFNAVKNTDLRDPKVLHLWLCKLCQILFEPKNLLFRACTNDPTKFYPNPELEPEPFHLDCLSFAGKVIAVALMHEIQVGIALDLLFLMQLAGKNISLEDARNVDSCLHNAGKDISKQGLELEDLNQVLKGKINLTSNSSKKKKYVNHDFDESDPLMSQLQEIRRQRINITDWQWGDFLGSGSFGRVYEVKVAPLLEGKKVDQIEQEIALLCQFSHPNILVRAGSLEKLYQKFQLRDSQVSLYTMQILKGLKYLHDRNVVHRDIKCANILVDEKGCVKIADFGLSKVTNLKTLMKSCWWNPRWMPPEVVNGKGGGYGFKADIWSIGCTVLEMSTRQIPYSHLEPGAVDYSIGEGNLPPLPDSLSKHSRDFILQCLQVNPDDRPTAAKLLGHPFVKGRCS